MQFFLCSEFWYCQWMLGGHCWLPRLHACVFYTNKGVRWLASAAKPIETSSSNRGTRRNANNDSFARRWHWRSWPMATTRYNEWLFEFECSRSNAKYYIFYDTISRLSSKSSCNICKQFWTFPSTANSNQSFSISFAKSSADCICAAFFFINYNGANYGIIREQWLDKQPTTCAQCFILSFGKQP